MLFETSPKLKLGLDFRAEYVDFERINGVCRFEGLP